MIATCPNPKCAAPIAEEHAYSWCTACGEPLTEPIQRRLPKLQEMRRTADAARAALGAEPEVEEICRGCGTRYGTSATLDFQGFRESNCPNCHFPSAHPLKWSYRITYWVFAVLLMNVVIQALVGEGRHDSIAGALILLAAVGKAIFKDLRVLQQRRMTVRNAELRS